MYKDRNRVELGHYLKVCNDLVYGYRKAFRDQRESTYRYDSRFKSVVFHNAKTEVITWVGELYLSSQTAIKGHFSQPFKLCDTGEYWIRPDGTVYIYVGS